MHIRATDKKGLATISDEPSKRSGVHQQVQHFRTNNVGESPPAKKLHAAEFVVIVGHGSQNDFFCVSSIIDVID